MRAVAVARDDDPLLDLLRDAAQRESLEAVLFEEATA